MYHPSKNNIGHKFSVVLACYIGAIIASWCMYAIASASTSAPTEYVYNGHLLFSSGSAVTSQVEVRFSFWTSGDFVAGDVNGAGAINTLAANYADFEDEFTVTPDANGYFTVRLGSNNPLPTIPSLSSGGLLNRYLQVEVKDVGDPDTSYELLDIDDDDLTNDRSPLLSVPYAQNADFIDQREVGSGSGNIATYASGGLLPITVIPAGTAFETYTLDWDDTGGTVALQFGTTLAEQLQFSPTLSGFIFTDDISVQGNISGTTLTISNLVGCDSLDTTALGTLICGTDAAGSGALNDTDELAEGAVNLYYTDERVDDRLGNFILSGSHISVVYDDPSNTLTIATVTGTSSGSIPELISGGVLPISTVPTGTNYNTFTLDSDNSGGNVILRFGNTLAEQLLFDAGSGTFAFTDDLLVQGVINIEQPEDQAFIWLSDTSNSTQVGLFTGSGTPLGVVSAEVGSLYIDSNSGRLYQKLGDNGGNTGWRSGTLASEDYILDVTSDTLTTSEEVILDDGPASVDLVASESTVILNGIIRVNAVAPLAALNNTVTIRIYRGTNCSGTQVGPDLIQNVNVTATGVQDSYVTFDLNDSPATAGIVNYTACALRSASAGATITTPSITIRLREITED